MIETKLDSMEKRFNELEKLLSDHDLVSRSDEYRKITIEHSELVPIIQKYNAYKRVISDLKGLEELKSSPDEELRVIASSEEEQLNAKKARIYSELKYELIPKDPNEGKNLIIEVRAGAGGDEAALFAGDLYRMYMRFAERHGWKTEALDGHSTGLGGFKEVIFGVSGKDAWKFYKYERGVHRVQRVPDTEASGRIHTSTVSVAVLPEVTEVEVNIKSEDLRIDTYKASGAGGQHVNKTESAIRITHLPTGIVVACQDERSQLKNRAKAFKILAAKLYEAKQQEQIKFNSDERKLQIGTGDRSEKIRTYNFPQNRITDHRINYSVHRIKEFLDGDLDELIAELIKDDHSKNLTV
jgi:peptide chain release factor 1